MEGGPNRTKEDLIFEKIPPLVGVFLLLFPFFASYIIPELAAYYIILLNIYFFYKSFIYALQFAIVLLKLRQNYQINWIEKIEGVRDVNLELKDIEYELGLVGGITYRDFQDKDDTTYLTFTKRLPKVISRILFNLEKQKTIRYLKNEYRKLLKLKERSIKNPDEIQHVVIIPHVKEPEEILRQTLDHIKNQTFNTKQINIVLAAEAADPNGVKVSEQLKREFKDVFNNIWITNHVLGENEIVGKSANMAWAGKEVAHNIKELGWDFKNVTITSCDADSKLPLNYFAYQTFEYITVEDSEYKFYNGAMLFYNNIWRLPFYARVKNSMSTIYNVGRLIRTDKLVPFSTYTTSLYLLDQVGYWTPWITPEDFHMFFKSLMKFPKKVEVIPLYTKIMSDAAEGDNHWETIKNNYKQERRWAWGISDDGWLLKKMFYGWRTYSIRVKYLAFHTVFDHIMGPVGSFIILVGGNIPTLLNPAFKNTVLGVRLPGISSFVISLTFVFMLTVIALDVFLKPRRENESLLQKVGRIFEWLVQPIAGFFLSVVPGLEAHTRLLFGKYLDYYVTKKSVDGTESSS